MRGGITSGVGFGVLQEDEGVFINLCWPLFSLQPVFLQKRNIALFPRKGPKSPLLQSHKKALEELYAFSHLCFCVGAAMVLHLM